MNILIVLQKQILKRTFSHPTFLWGKSYVSNCCRKIRNISRFATISDTSAGSTPRRNQSRSEM